MFGFQVAVSSLTVWWLTFVLPLFNLSLISPFLLKTKLKGLYIDEENLLSDIGQF